MNKLLKIIIKSVTPYGLIILFRYLRKKIHSPSFDWIMSENERLIFKKYINNAKIYLEFGSGGSTIAALNNTNVKIYSIESSKEWMKIMRNKYKIIINSEKTGQLNFIYADIGNTGDMGIPKISFNDNDFDRFLNYSQKIFYDYPEIKKADIVLIDGRFRVACCLSVLLETDNNTLIMIHDFWDRPQYHIIKDYVNIIDRIDSMLICKRNVNISDDEIRKEYDKYKYTYE